MWYATTDKGIASKEDAYAKVYEQAIKEVGKWPYRWMEEKDYAAKTRGSLKGRFSVKNGTIKKEVRNDLTVKDSV